MIDINELEACMARKHKTRKECAAACGISPKTFYSRMKTGVFGLDEAEALIDFLQIDNPCAIFFASKVASEGTNE